MRLRDLGTLLLDVGDEHPVAGSRAPAILALLLIHANHRVSGEALMEAAWGDRAGRGSVSTLESHVWRLRRLLEPGRGPGEAPAVLVNDAGGYRLLVADSDLDSTRFSALAAESRDVLAAGNAERALALADEALALWRGRPYGSFADEEWAAPAVARLSETREQLLERRISALLAVGRPDQALADLEPLLAELPYREGLWGQRMLALYRSGRVNDALQAYRTARRLLREEIGVDPGPALQELHRQILQQDPRLDPLPAERPGAAAPPVEVHLPSRLTPLVGRSADLVGLQALLREQRLVTLAGSAGCGKTRLAIEVARGVAAHYPDGVWFLDLTDATDPDLVLDVVTSAIGLAVPPVGGARQALTDYVRGRRLLLVLDNCEHVLDGAAELVESILTPSSAVAVLATSREPLEVDGETIWALGPLALPEPRDAIPLEAPAVELFLQRLRAAVPTLELDEDRRSLAVDICRAVDGVPLALELAAAQARSLDLTDIARQAMADASDLSRVGRGPRDHRQTVRSAIEWSYRLMSPAEQRLHRRLAVLPGSFSRPLANAVAADGPDEEDVGILLARLVHRSLLTSVAPQRPGGPSLFSQLATVRGHARHALLGADDPDLAERRRDDWVSDLFAARPRLGSSGEREWFLRVDDAYPAVRATLRRLVEQPDPPGLALSSRLLFYWYYRNRLLEGTRWLQQALRAGRPGTRPEQVRAALMTAAGWGLRSRMDQAREPLQDALQAVDDSGIATLDVGEDLVLTATAFALNDQYESLDAINQRLGRIAGTTADPHLAAFDQTFRCMVQVLAGELDGVATGAEAAYASALETDNLMAAWLAGSMRSLLALRERQPESGLQWSDRVLGLQRRMGSGPSGAVLETRAGFAVLREQPAEAVRLFAASRVITRRNGLNWPRRALSRELLTGLQDRLPRPTYEQAWRDGEAEALLDPGAVGG